MPTIQFKKDKKDHEFSKVLHQRVHQYFKENKLSKTANDTAIIKAILLFSAYLIIFVALFFSPNLVFLYMSYAILGCLTIFVALNVAHDAAHNTFSSQKKVNDYLLYTFDFLGASGYMWRLKHVHSHHPHVNIPNMDGDIKQSNLVRIFPNSPYLFFHRYQYLYMPLLYLFYTLVWLCFRDFKDYFQTNISGKPSIVHKKKEYAKLFIGKLFFLGRMVILPCLLLPFSMGQILGGFVIFHFCASFTVALALISAHIGADSVYPEPDSEGKMEQSWIRHQIVTTCDFATDNKIISHLFGGFNHHVVHHLFPNICHIHYPKLTLILAQTCQEFDMPYKMNETLLDAVLSHLRFLKIRSIERRPIEYLEI